MKSYTLTFVLALLVVLASVSLRKTMAANGAASANVASLVAIGPEPVPWPPTRVAIGPEPVPWPPTHVAIGPEPVPWPPAHVAIGPEPVPWPPRASVK